MKNHKHFIRRSIIATLDFLKDAVFCEEYALQNGFLQSLDPRVKVITFLLFVIAVLLAKSIATLFILYALCLVLALISRINLEFFLKRTWIFIPLFSLFIALPAIFSQGNALFTFNFLGLELIISRQGLDSALIFVLRVVTSVSFIVLLSMTTRHFALLKVLRIFKVPQVFVMVLGICYRYVYLFVGIIQDTFLAIKSRVGAVTEYRKGQHIVAANIAALWQRSEKLNAEVYKAMLSRGYQGEALSWDDFKIKTKDYLWLLAVVVIIWII